MTPPIPTQTKALIQDPKTHAISLSTDQTPKPTKTQYLIKTHAVGITKGELLWPEPNTLSTPIPGFDFAGTIVQSPSPNAKFKEGDGVYGLTSFSRSGNARDITVAEESEVALSPRGLGWGDAASVPMSGLTAWQALFIHAGLSPVAKDLVNAGKRVLVVGASGAVGIWAVQLAAWAGCYVVGMLSFSQDGWHVDAKMLCSFSFRILKLIASSTIKVTTSLSLRGEALDGRLSPMHDEYCNLTLCSNIPFNERQANSHSHLGICGTNNVDFVKDLGVDATIDYRKTNLKEYIDGKLNQKFDVVLDGVGGSSLKEAWTAVKANSILISIVEPAEALKPDEGVSDGVKGMFFIVEPDGTQLEPLTGLIEEGKIRTVVDGVWSFKDFEKAFEKVESGRARGKVIIDVVGDV
jgi:NADPH:quinone reductase-like Zn-dependent oxidoreductase